MVCLNHLVKLLVVLFKFFILFRDFLCHRGLLFLFLRSVRDFGAILSVVLADLTLAAATRGGTSN